MKNFSLRALGASLLAFGLVIAGAALPASAAALTFSLTSINTSTATPAGMTAEITNAKFQNPSNPSQKLDKIVIGPTNSVATWTPLQTCTGFANQVTPALCGIDSIKFNNVDVTSGWSAYYISPKIYLIKNNAGTGYNDGESIQINFLSGAFTSPSTAVFATFTFETMYLGGSQLDFVQSAVTVGTPTSTVTFNANGGSGTMSNQTSGSAANLTSNAFTKSGYTFGGWASTQQNAIAGTVFLANGASYDFQTSRTLYAIWTANSSGGSGSGSSSSNSLANTGINSVTGISLLAGGLSLALVGAEMFMIARRKLK
jgi:uncharacterized repeat protein (TIGR02543 family)